MTPLTCPFCGLLCDDLPGSGPAPGQCDLATRRFQVPDLAPARLSGQPVDTAEAVTRAARLLGAARRPLIGGLACDVVGQRAALALAERLGGVLDHMNGPAQFRNLLAFQDGGWMTTTLSEVRNRADVILLAGTAAGRFPRFFQRLLTGDAQFRPERREILALGPADADTLAPWTTQPPLVCPPERLGEVFAALRTRLAGRPLAAPAIAGLPAQSLESLLATLRGARYGVLVWNAAELDFPQADLTVRALLDLVADLNTTTRWAGLPLGGNDGDTSAAQVGAWRAGYPCRFAYDASGPHYDPVRHDHRRLLASGEADALLWISAFDPERPPPAVDCPVIVLGRADLALPRPPEVFLPVAVPGVQRRGFLHRMDGVVALPLAAPHASPLPGVDEVLAAIHKELDHAQA